MARKAWLLLGTEKGCKGISVQRTSGKSFKSRAVAGRGCSRPLVLSKRPLSDNGGVGSLPRLDRVDVL